MEYMFENSQDTILLNVYQIPFLHEHECKELCSISEKEKIPNEGSMQKYTLNVEKTLYEFMHHRLLPYFIPLIQKIFDYDENTRYYVYNAHIILYNSGDYGEKSLKLHIDDSDITLNITLEQSIDFTGNELEFYGTTPFGNEILQKTYGKLQRGLQHTLHTVKTTPGYCILHRGNHPHQTRMIQKGTRKALIIWLKKY